MWGPSEEEVMNKAILVGNMANFLLKCGYKPDEIVKKDSKSSRRFIRKK